MRIRGNAHQVLEKYQNLARDAHTNGDRVLAESYYQFAEHYYRIVHESTDPESPGSQRSHQRDDRDERDEGGRNEAEENEADGRAEQGGNRRRNDRSQPRQRAESHDAEEQPKQDEANAAAPAVNGEAPDSDRDGLERALGAKTLVLSSEEAAKEAGQEGEPADEEDKPSKSNGSRSTRSRSRYRRSSTRTKETEEGAPQRRQFPMPADANEQAEEGEGQES